MPADSVQDVINYYIKQIDNFGYHIITDCFDCAARTDNKYHLVLINPKKITAFIIVHEYFHIYLNHTGRLTAFNGNDERNPNEHEANLQAIRVLLQIYSENHYELNYIDFMTMFGIPFWLESTVINMIKTSINI